ERDPRLAQRVCPSQPSIGAELVRAVLEEWAVTLSDVLLRRTPIGLHACQGLDCLESPADYLPELLGGPPAERQRQIAEYKREIEPMRRFSSESTAASV